ADDKEKRLKSADEVIQSYIEGVLRVLDNLGYTQEEILKMAGVYGKVEERNVLRFLAEIEEYINKLWMLQNYDAYQIDQEKRKTSMLGAARITTPLPNRIEVEFRAVVLPPAHTHEMDDFMDDRQGTSVRPITLREVGVATDMVLKEACYSGRGRCGHRHGSSNRPVTLREIGLVTDMVQRGPSPSERWAWSQTWFRQETCRSQRDSLGHRRGSAVRLVTLKEVGVLADTVLPSGLPPS
ncbi:hypothetical protein BaRGS_00011286, partial [Batillaria attramentaria]